MGLWQVVKSQFLCHLIICYVFLASGLIINLVQICTLPLWLVNKQLARRVNVRLGYCISSRKSALPCASWMSVCVCVRATVRVSGLTGTLMSSLGLILEDISSVV